MLWLLKSYMNDPMHEIMITIITIVSYYNINLYGIHFFFETSQEPIRKIMYRRGVNADVVASIVIIV